MSTRPGLLACRQQWADREFTDLDSAQDALAAVLALASSAAVEEAGGAVPKHRGVKALWGNL